MSFKTIQQEILKAFDAGWSASLPYTLDNMDNINGTAVRKKEDLEQYVNVRVLPAVTRQLEIAVNPFKRTEGIVQVSWFGKANIGTSVGLGFLDIAKDIFELKTINSITFLAGRLINVGEADGFYNLVMSVPFFTDTKT